MFVFEQYSSYYYYFIFVCHNFSTAFNKLLIPTPRHCVTGYELCVTRAPPPAQQNVIKSSDFCFLKK